MNKQYSIDEHQQDLINKLKAGTPAAFKLLVEQYRDQVINTCYRFVFNREDAEDIAQEVFIEIHRSISFFREQARISTWIYRIAVTKSIDYIRKTKRKKRLAPIKNMLGIEDDVEKIPSPTGNGPAENLEQEERMKILQQAIDELPENQRIAFTLNKCRGVRNKEIAEIMGITLSSVESLMHRAKKNLEKKLYHYFEKDLKRKGKLFVFFLIVMILLQLSAYGAFARGNFKRIVVNEWF